MAKFIGRLVNVGVGTESARGTQVVPQYWLPQMEVTIDDGIEQAVNESAIGVIEDAEDAEVTLKFAEGTITGRVDDTSFGVWLLAALGSEAVATASGEGAVYDHTFTVGQTAQHPSLTIAIDEPNAGDGDVHTLSMVDSLELNVELGQYATYTVNFRGNVSATASPALSASFSSLNTFLPQHGTVKLASTIGALDAASATTIKNINITISKNVEDDHNIGSDEVTDRLNKQFSVEGTMELLYDDRTFIDTLLVGDTTRAVRVALANTGITLGSATNPSLTFDLAKVKLNEVGRSLSLNDLVSQTVSFKGFYSQDDSKMISAVLTNTQAAAY